VDSPYLSKQSLEVCLRYVIDQRDEFLPVRRFDSDGSLFLLIVVRPGFAVDSPTRMRLVHICACCILVGAVSQRLSQTQSGSSTVTAGARSSQSAKITAHAAQLIHDGNLKGALTELDVRWLSNIRRGR